MISIKSIQNASLSFKASARKHGQLPKEILNLANNLKVLRINHSHAAIKNLALLSGLKALEGLDLEDCPIDHIPEEWKALRRLKVLNVKNTHITTIPAWFKEEIRNCTIII